METKPVTGTPDGSDLSPEVRKANEEMVQEAMIRQQQQQNLQRVAMSGSTSYYTHYDKVVGFCALALEKGACYIGNVTENPPAHVLVGRKEVIVEQMDKLIPLLNKMIANGGAISLEHRAEMLDYLVDSVYSLMGLGVNLGLPFDIGFEIVHQANMQKCIMKGAPIINDAGKLVQPEGWKEKYHPKMPLFEAMMELTKLEHKVRNPLKSNNLPDPKGTGDETTGLDPAQQSPLIVPEQLG